MSRFCLAVAVATLALGVAVPAQAAKLSPVLTRGPATVQGQSKPATELSTFTGSIKESGDQFVFTDDQSKTSYQLDNQQAASKFEGKRVKIIGTLDAADNTIRVQSIEAATA